MSNTSQAFHSTAVAAVNQALVVLGQDVTLTAAELATDSTVANGRKAAFLYEQARLRVLRDHTWSFARAEIETGGTTAVPDRETPFRCQVPAKCVRLIACHGEGGRRAAYRVVDREIRSDIPIERIAFVRDIEDLDKWSADAYRALVLRLAADLAKPVTGRINERQLQEQAYDEAITTAKLTDARENNIPHDAYDGNHYAEAMRGDRRFRRDDIFRRP